MHRSRIGFRSLPTKSGAGFPAPLQNLLLFVDVVYKGQELRSSLRGALVDTGILQNGAEHTAGLLHQDVHGVLFRIDAETVITGSKSIKTAGFSPDTGAGFHPAAEKSHPVQVTGKIGKSKCGLTVELIVGVAVQTYCQCTAGQDDLFTENLRGIPGTFREMIIFFTISIDRPLCHRS